MDKSLLNGSGNANIYDCVGIGFGPSNIALAIALEEKGLLENSLFLEVRDEVLWHPGMLIEGTDIQHNPLRDFVTPRNPCSPYGFLSYLKSENRLFDYLNLSAPFPPRTEYAGYVSWVAKQFANYVQFGIQVSNITSVSDEFDNGLIGVQSSNGTCFYARSVVVGCGRSRYIPTEFRKLLGDNVIHSDDYMWAKQRWLQNSKKPKIAVIGGSQSAVEILLNLSESCEVIGVTRSFGFKQKDLSPFTECIYYPEFVDYFHGAKPSEQNNITKEFWRSNYSAADHDVINALNFRLYEQKVAGQNDIQIYQNSVIENIEHSPEKDAYTLHLKDRYNQKTNVVIVDGVVFATGYKNFGALENQEPYHPLLEGVASSLVFRDDGGPDVLRDYRLNIKNSSAPVYLNGLCEASHGFGDAGSFSILSIRGDVIASSLEKQIQQQPQAVTTQLGVAEHV